jgi:hypothetical protein
MTVFLRNSQETRFQVSEPSIQEKAEARHLIADYMGAAPERRSVVLRALPDAAVSRLRRHAAWAGQTGQEIDAYEADAARDIVQQRDRLLATELGVVLG